MGRQTLFTFEKSEERDEKILNKLLYFLHDIMNRYTISNPILKNFIEKNCLYLILFSAFKSKENFSTNYLHQLEPYLPVSIMFFEKFINELSPFMKDINLSKILNDTELNFS